MTLKEGERYKRGMRLKTFTFLSGYDESQSWRLDIVVREDGSFAKKGTTFDIIFQNPNKTKQDIRAKDREWVMQNIPSSIWWKTQIHHVWEDGARMYLLSKLEHIKQTREERKHGL